MAEGKRYYWLRLHDDFFQSKRIKKLRKLAGGDTYTIIYLKMQLLSIKNEGQLEYTGLESTFAEELALDIDESPEDVQVTINYLLSCGLLETNDETNYFLPYAVENTGSETSAAQRVREHRERQQLLQCNTDVTKCNTDVTQVKQICNGEKEIEKEKKIKKDIEKDIYSGLDDEVVDVLKEFEKMRTKIKKPMTDRAIEMLITKLKGMSSEKYTQIAILDQSITHCWQDIYELKAKDSASASRLDKTNIRNKSTEDQLKAYLGDNYEDYL